MHKRVKAAVCAGAVGGLGLTLALSTTSFADVQPQAKDIVGVGSDTVQYLGDFVNDGDPNADAGYNSVERTRRIFSFDATADAGGAAVYGPGGVATVPNIVPRAGGFPLARPNGSGDGIGQFLHDTTAPFTYNYVRSSRLPNATEESTAAGIPSFGGGLHVYQVASDGLDLAVNNQATGVTAGDPVTCAPAAGLTGAQVLAIYKGTTKVWGDIAGYVNPAGSTCSTEGILPLIPQTGSGTRNDFIADLQNTYNGGVAFTLGANVATVEEHDPRGITSQVSHTDSNGNTVNKQDAISPFSTGRYNLIQTGYFDHTLAIKGGTQPVLANTIGIQTGGTAYHLNRFLYIITRQADVTSATPFLAGTTLNWVNTFFGTATSWYAKAANASLFTSAGVTQAWVNKGLNP